MMRYSVFGSTKAATPSLIDKIEENKKLLTDEQILHVKKLFQNNPDLRTLHDKSITPYTIIRITHILEQRDTFCAIYYGRKKAKHIGSGAFSKIKFLQDLDTGTWLAVKFFTDVTQAQNEADILKKINRLHGVLYHYKSKYSLIIMNYIHGINLEDFISKHSHIPISKKIIIAKNILCAAQALYEQNILHCDIKPTNIIIDEETTETKFIDFQFAQIGKNFKLNARTAFGSEYYMAPELIQPNVFPLSFIYDQSTEIYALGMTLVELFADDIHLSPSLENIINRMCAMIIAYRPSYPEVIAALDTCLVELTNATEPSSLSKKCV